jgi:hypothetical protein
MRGKKPSCIDKTQLSEQWADNFIQYESEPTITDSPVIYETNNIKSKK